MWMRAAWVLFILLVVVGFAVLESYALNHDQSSLSRFVYDMNQAWPLTSFLLGGLFFGLGVHFFWNWDPRLYKAQEEIKRLNDECARLREKVNELSGKDSDSHQGTGSGTHERARGQASPDRA